MSKPRLTSRVVRGLREIRACEALIDRALEFTFENGAERSAGLRRVEARAALEFLDKLAAWHDEKLAMHPEAVSFLEEPPPPDVSIDPPPDHPFPAVATLNALGSDACLVAVYKNPKDYPGRYVVRRWALDAGRVVAEFVPVAVVGSLEDARVAVAAVTPSTRVRLEPDSRDDPTIVETWIW